MSEKDTYETMNEPDVSIVIPLFNEEGNLGQLSTEIRQALADHRWTYEILFVDDGSTDGSHQALMELAREDNRIRVLRLAQNLGQSAALAVGFRAARAAIVVTLDADLQNDPADIPNVLIALEQSDVVSGIRHLRQDDWLRRMSSRVANTARRLALGDSITDIGCALKAYRSAWLQTVPAFNGMHRFLPCLLEAWGAVVKEIPVHHRPRIHGESKYGLHNRLWRGLYDLVGVRWLISRWITEQGVEDLTKVP
jgi:glycosyltransferase involved in cell wall biosynthesis